MGKRALSLFLAFILVFCTCSQITVFASENHVFVDAEIERAAEAALELPQGSGVPADRLWQITGLTVKDTVTDWSDTILMSQLQTLRFEPFDYTKSHTVGNFSTLVRYSIV